MTFWRMWRQCLGAGGAVPAVTADARRTAPAAPAEAAALFERLDHLLSLAGRCPPGAASDRLRRSVYESIEAVSVTDRRKHLVRVLDELDGMRRHNLAIAHRSAAGSSIAVEPLLTALHAAVVSILAPESRHDVGV